MLGTKTEEKKETQNYSDESEHKGQRPIIEIGDLNVIYNRDKSNEVRALENVSFKIYPEEFVIIFGPSGCGKSTLLYAISGLEKPTGEKFSLTAKIPEDTERNSGPNSTRKRSAWFSSLSI